MAKQIMGLLAIGAALLTVAGCSKGELGQTMGSWQGSHLDDVMLAWGSPDNCGHYHGRHICEWRDAATGLVPATVILCERSLEIDPDGYVIGWRWRGDQCAATADRVMARADYRRPDALAVERESSDDVGIAATDESR